MKDLFTSILGAASNQGQAASIIKHLKAVSISDWPDLTKSNLYELRDHLGRTVSPNTAKTVAASLKAFLRRFEDDVQLPKGWGQILAIKGEKPLKTFLTAKEIAAFEEVPTFSRIEQYVKSCFLISCWTGMRVSDARQLTPENIQDGMLSYVSQKTGALAVIPAKPGLWEHIETLQKWDGGEVYLATYNAAVRRLARRAGITEKVKVHRAGQTMIVEKWQALSSHSGRVSIATCLADAGASLTDIKQTLGHSSEAMSSRYVVPHVANLSAKAMAFFK